ncbi:RHS repeat-associated core domain-containing protein [Pseudomonas wadenswilerensis]
MKRNWKDLGEVWSGRDLAAGEEVTLNVFDKSLGILLEQIPFRPSRNRRTRHLWVKDFCLYINAHSALIHAGEENAAGDWDVICSRYRNHYRNLTTRELVVTTTVPSAWNWSSDRCVPLKVDKMYAGMRMRVNVRSATGVLLESMTFTPDRFGKDELPQDLAAHINAFSRFVRAGCANGESIEPQPGATANAIWLPHNGDFTVRWFRELDELGCLIATERDAIKGERLSVFVFDNKEERLIERITLVAGADGTHLGETQWPTDLATRINASSVYMQASVPSGNSDGVFQEAEYIVHKRIEQHSVYCALPNIKSWVHALDMTSSVDLKPHERVQVKVTTRGKGNLCETLTFTPDPNRLKTGQWQHDLALYINAQSLFLRAGAKDEASKTFIAREDSKGNSFWLPQFSKPEMLQVNMATVSLKEVGYISAERDLDPGEGCTAYVLDDTSEEVLEEIEFTPAAKRNGSSLAPNDLAERINSRTQLIAAGEKKSNEAPLPIASGYRNALWACDPNVRAFTTFMSLKNWVKGPALGSKDFESNQQMVIRVRGSKTGRILESQVFWPRAGRLDLQAWTRDLCNQVNSFCRFLRAGEGNATSFVIAASDSRDGNCFWTPAGSGLVVEAEILSGFRFVARQTGGHKVDQEEDDPVELAGMSSEDKRLFDHYTEARRLISVDARTGLPTLQIPVAELYADDSLSEPLKVSLSFDEGVFLSLGNTTKYVSMPGGKYGNVFILPLRDGRRVKVDTGMVDDINGGDFTISPRFVIEDIEPYCVGFKVTYKDGGTDEFLLAGRFNKGGFLPKDRYSISSGGELRLESSSDLGLITTKVTKNSETLLEEIVERGGEIKSIVVYPNNSTEKITWSFSKLSDLQLKLEVNGLGVNGKVVYCIATDRAKRLISVEAEQQHSFTVNKSTETDKAVYKEILEYDSAGKVKLHDICPGAGLDDLIHEYTYSDTESVLTGYFKSTTPKTAFTRTHGFTDGQTNEEKYGSEAVPVSCLRSHSIDSDKKCMVSSTEVWEGDVQVDEQRLIVDTLGNPLSHLENDRVTRYTYYNNYQQYEVIESKEKVENTTFFGWLLKPLDYLFPTGWACLIGGAGGLTWGTHMTSEVNMTSAKNNYAKDAFNLPVDIVHCGSDKPFSGDVESELVTRKVNGVEEAQSLSYFGYEKINGRAMLKKKLTVLQPNYEEVDVADKQLKVAQAAAKELTDSLNTEIANADAASKKTFEDALKALNKSLKAQSEVNRKGYKLGAWKSASMSVETYEYHTDSSKAGYGTIKSIDRVLLGDDGKEVETSRRITKMEYSQDTADANRVVIKTTVSRQGDTDVVSSQTRSRHTGRLYESVDSQGFKTVYTYDGQGNLTSETVSKDDATRSKTTATLVRTLAWQFDLVEGDVTSRLEKDVLGRKVAMWVKPKDAGAFLETQRWTYDLRGRTLTSVENDYGASNKKISQRQTNWTHDGDSGALTIENILKDGDGKELKKISQSVTPVVNGELFRQGSFSVDRRFDPGTDTLTEHYATTGGSHCKIERSMTADGLMTSVRYLKVDANDKESEVDKISFQHDKYGQMEKVTPQLGAASAYEYDSAGRLLKTTRDGVRLINEYDSSTLAPVSATSKAELTNPSPLALPSMYLGTQSVDMLGRVTSQDIYGPKTEFSYVGASAISTLKSVPAAPATVAGYSRNLDQASRTHTQTVKQGNVEQTSTLVFSTGGRVLSFTDLTGVTTVYEYDFFNRVVRSSNDHCESTFVYGDNGLLASESIKAVKVDITMKVAYVYDELGQETARTFTCDGLETIASNRDLLADGRVKAASCMQGGREERFDRYEYDSSLRLKSWIAWNDFDEFRYDCLGNMISGSGHQFYYDEMEAGIIVDVGHLPPGHERSPQQGNEVTYDAAGRMIAERDRRVSYHANGQIHTYSTDANKTKYTFSYDSEGRVRGGTIGNKTDTYHYRGECAYAVVQSDSGKGAEYSKRTLVLRNDSRACLMQDALVDDTDSKTTRSFELRDAAGTVFASIDLASKSVTLFRHTPYGEWTDGEKSTTWLGFKGEPLNRMRLYHFGNGYRIYDPAWGRFLTRDSLSPFGAGGAAGYVFCNGDPVNYHDPSGHQIVAQYERWSTAPLIETTVFRVVIGALGVVISPFTAGMSALLAVATTALAVVSFSLDVASIILSESDPELARTLETWGQAFAIAGAAAGFSMMVHGWKGFPKNIFKVRGGPSHPTPVKWIKTPAELRLAQQARTRALDGLIRGAQEAKAAGTFDAFKATYLHPEPILGGGARVAGASSLGLGARMSGSTKNLFTGVIRQADDGFDFLGFMLDMNSGPNTLVSKFATPAEGETTLVSIVSGPFPGRERLFP